ncbi:MAG: hypothetical protein DWQ18_00215 [Crenarchaeota archaeon]|nr:MAG: hypothetical protein DWQ17_05000 [Thermoproteota archaeon]RDJ34413.1 MAG: hypothetical protein DWQ18_00215 [Thermoproteota archaeon]RDJ34752.1 MAG: hypothetical protein DWQ19_13330 [Thermoproteota archaeon]RDJ38647.1 MAG: hypothetical protein DWQ13_04605 [Thermoproteota archaeon]
MKLIVGGYIAIIIGIVVAFGVFTMDAPESKNLFSVTLAEPNMYQEGVYTSSFEIFPGEYKFRFVPNGDSPQILSIKLTGENFSFSEDFDLQGTPHESGAALYYTWDYLGEKEFQILEEQELEIIINPNGNTMGPVSIQIVDDKI